ncbi:MAG: hypothetical protein AAF513_03840 [Pseudomonadota bacterium]
MARARLIGRGATAQGETYEGCEILCELPDSSSLESGLMPSVLHSYVAYAKDIGLQIQHIVHVGNSPYEFADHFVYSLWALLYVNNSEMFVGASPPGLGVWQQAEENTPLVAAGSIQLNEKAGYFHRGVDTPAPEIPEERKEADGPDPAPGARVKADKAWVIGFENPSEPKPKLVVTHYSELLVHDIVRLLVEPDRPTVVGLKAATAALLEDVAGRAAANLPLLPDWLGAGEAPKPYTSFARAANDYNIGASLLYFDKDQHADPSNPHTQFRILGTSLNIKGKIKIAHAETRVLLALDALTKAKETEKWWSQVNEYLQLDELHIGPLMALLGKGALVLISSLKPCYMCAGEIDASEEGRIRSIDRVPVEAYAAFPGVPFQPNISEVIYFDIDAQIEYYSRITSLWSIGGDQHEVHLYRIPWHEWAAHLPDLPCLGEMGPRITFDAGPDLKSPSAMQRYRNSIAYLKDPAGFVTSIERQTKRRSDLDIAGDPDE